MEKEGSQSNPIDLTYEDLEMDVQDVLTRRGVAVEVDTDSEPSSEESEDMARNRKRNKKSKAAKGGNIDVAPLAAQPPAETDAERRERLARESLMADLGNARAFAIRNNDAVRAKAVDGKALAKAREALKQGDGWMNSEKAGALAIWGNMKEDNTSDDDGTAGQAHRAALNRKFHGIGFEGEDIPGMGLRREFRSARGGRISQAGRGGGFAGARGGRGRLRSHDDGTLDFGSKRNKASMSRAPPFNVVPKKAKEVAFDLPPKEAKGPQFPTPPPRGPNMNEGKQREPPVAPPRAVPRAAETAGRSKPTPLQSQPAHINWNMPMNNDDFMEKVKQKQAERQRAKAASNEAAKHQTVGNTAATQIALTPRIDAKAAHTQVKASDVAQTQTKATDTAKPFQVFGSEAASESGFEPSMVTKAANAQTKVTSAAQAQATAINAKAAEDKDIKAGNAQIKDVKATSAHGNVSTEAMKSETAGFRKGPVKPTAAEEKADSKAVNAWLKVTEHNSPKKTVRSRSVICNDIVHEKHHLKLLSMVPRDSDVIEQEQYAREKIKELNIELEKAMIAASQFDPSYVAGKKELVSSNVPSGIKQTDPTAFFEQAALDTTQLTRQSKGKGTGDLLSWSPEKQEGSVENVKVEDRSVVPPYAQDVLFGAGTAPSDDPQQILGESKVASANTRNQQHPKSQSAASIQAKSKGIKDSIHAPGQQTSDKSGLMGSIFARPQPVSRPSFNAAKAYTAEEMIAVRDKLASSTSTSKPNILKTFIHPESLDKPLTPSEMVKLNSKKTAGRVSQTQGAATQVQKNVQIRNPFAEPRKVHTVAPKDMSRSVSPKSPTSNAPASIAQPPSILDVETGSFIEPQLSHKSSAATKQPVSAGNLIEQVGSPQYEDLMATRPTEHLPIKRNSELLAEAMSAEPSPTQAETIVKHRQGKGLAASVHSQGPSKEELRRQEEMKAPVAHLFQGYNERRKGHQIPAWLLAETRGE